MIKNYQKPFSIALLLFLVASAYTVFFAQKTSAASITTVAANQTDTSWKNSAASACNANTVHAMYFNNAIQTGTRVTFYINAFSYRCANATKSATLVYSKLTSIVESPNTDNIDLSSVTVPTTFYSNITLGIGTYTPIYAYGPFTIDLKTAGLHYFNINFQVGSFGTSTNSGVSGLSLNIVDVCSNIAGVQNPKPDGYTVIGGQCGRPPTGSITASCSSNKVTVTYTTSDLDGGNLTVTLTANQLQTFPKTDTRPPDTNFILAGSPFNFTGTINTTYSITGTVKDSIGLGSTLTPAQYICKVPAAVECSFISPLPGDYEPGDSVTPKMEIRRVADLGTTSLSVTQTAKINTTTYSSSAVTISNAASTQTITYPTLLLPEPTTAGTSLYTLTGSISWTGGSSQCSELFRVARKPFFTVTKGDLSVGGGYDSLCTAASNGNVYSWAGATNTSGANSSHVAKIFGTALEYYSGSKFNTTNNKKYLTLSNSTAASWGGSFGAGTCMTDLYDISDNPATSTNPYAPENGFARKQFVGNLTLNGNSAFTGQNALYVNGDVYITGDIKNGSSSYYIDPVSGKILMPFYALIVKGNIYIAPSVKQLDGVYSASDAILTCATGFGSFPSNYYSTCGNQLTFNGLVQAKSIKLQRVNGTLKTNTPAEIFNGLPELYLAKTPFVDNTPNATKYDSASLLPPLL